MNHQDRRAASPVARTTSTPVPVSAALRRFAEEYFTADEAEQNKGRRRSGRTSRKQVKRT